MYCSTVYNKEEFETTFYLQKVVKLYDTCTVEYYATVMGFPGGSVVKTLPAMQETWVRYLGWEDPLEKGMATHSSSMSFMNREA